MPQDYNSHDFRAGMEQMRRKSRAGSDALRRNFRTGRTDEQPKPHAQLCRPCQQVQPCRPCPCPCDHRDGENFTEEFHERQVDYVRTKREDV
ncbi:MAG: hypothetical protein FWE40_01220 [Oscillospiraceae bacterium]|nr:hypothetical protein [Oscillospiraceae bacterium]